MQPALGTTNAGDLAEFVKSFTPSTPHYSVLPVCWLKRTVSGKLRVSSDGETCWRSSSWALGSNRSVAMKPMDGHNPLIRLQKTGGGAGVGEIKVIGRYSTSRVPTAASF